MAGIKDVAREAGVSTATVSRALRAMQHVNPETRAKIEAAAKKLNYKLNTGKNTEPKRANSVGIIAPYISRWYFAKVIQGAEQALQEAGLDLLVYNINQNNDRNRIFKDEYLRGRIDALINTAGVVGPTNVKVEDVKWADFENTLRINLFGTVWLTQAVIPYMKSAKYGRIAHVASIAGKEGNPGMTPYNVSKSGMIGFVKGVAKEIAPDGITINALAPAVIRTPMNADTSDETLKYMISRIPMGRVGEAEEVAEILAFMGSSACSFTTGFTFDASGG